ncbi:MAG: hypothetical protein ACRDK3_12505 [Actinomycetota bacterium]
MSASEGARLEIERAGDGRWSWRYVDPSLSVDLSANTTFSSPHEAASSAQRAYPEIKGVIGPPSVGAPSDDVGDVWSQLMRLLVALALFAAMFAGLRRLANHRASMSR